MRAPHRRHLIVWAAILLVCAGTWSALGLAVAQAAPNVHVVSADTGESRTPSRRTSGSCSSRGTLSPGGSPGGSLRAQAMVP